MMALDLPHCFFDIGGGFNYRHFQPRHVCRIEFLVYTLLQEQQKSQSMIGRGQRKVEMVTKSVHGNQQWQGKEDDLEYGNCPLVFVTSQVSC